MKTATKNKTVNAKKVTVKILEKDVQIACAPGDEDDLVRAARHVDQSMRQFRERSNTSTVEKIAIITAISTANELLKQQSGATGSSPAKTSNDARQSTGNKNSGDNADNELIDDSIQERIQAMQARLDSVLQD